jgi:quinoprotein glucose dehydrogenase
VSGKLIAAAGFAAVLLVSGSAGAQTPPPPSKFEALFQARCAACHEPPVERAPARADIAQMAPGQILGALQGVMAPMAAGLSKDEMAGLATYLASAPKPQAAVKAPASAGSIASSVAPHAPAPAAKTFEWRAYGADYASSRYAPLDQINKDTAKYLHVAWRQSLTPDVVRQSGAGVPPAPNNNETTPIMVGGLVYYSTGIGGVAALDAATGKVVWHVDRAAGPGGGDRLASVGDGDGDGVAFGAATRSLTYWPDGKDGRIIALIGNKYLTALNAKTGKRIADFGAGGQVDLRRGQYKDQSTFSWKTGPTVIVRGVVIIGSYVTDINSARAVSTKSTPRGDVRGIDARTGKQLWIWHSVPLKGEFGADTWLNNSGEYSGSVNVWAAMSGDEALGQVYLPETTPTNDWYGGKRPGANLFAESIIALDARTGKRVWHFQGVHHGLWDYDFPCAPVLVDITVKGKKIKALAQPSKQAYLYVLDRATGKPIWPIIEKPVAAGDVPGEWYSPTQPMPLNGAGKPFAYDQQGVTVDDLIDFTPELRAEAVKMLDQYAIGPMFIPPVIAGQGRGAGKVGSLHMAGSFGGTNWPGAGFDPETGILYVPSSHTPVVANMVPSPAGSDTGYVRQRYIMPRGPQGLPLFKPPYGRLVAIDLNKGEIKWTAANGEGPRDHPAIKSLNLPALGEPGRVGPLVTKSLVFMGEGLTQDPPGSGGKKFRAFDKATGKVVWETTLDGEATGVPMSYAWQGKQYIIVPIGGAGHPGEFVALTVD